MYHSQVPAPVPHIQRVVAKDFPFHDAILLEECCCYDIDVLQRHYKGSAMFLVATAVYPQLVDFPEDDPRGEGDLMGFLVSDVDRDDDGEVYGVLKNLAVSCAEEDPDSIRTALIRRWQEECCQELWDGLRASFLSEQEAERTIFLREAFRSIDTCPCCDAEVFQWQSGETQSHAL
ncbi:hypothetical protein A3H22_03395 [Candidatus Peribacteria bacterium RIFCSPLOWO2_12_FULL_55_15]|nr:MAG: hypothetical protein A2789_01080 [Candidatus Peribacteria bacterium RIFCSPHIGHO2_01_FULL_54_22]OGJ62225.1 MAG: hypothetical protein A3D12_00195 [Candidatus Peribacteria bacterium RIFCSPHIGHO2_02_FULL_55_24]OGJ64140.1 MAG: hypothetical protein A3E47_03765 [Candidatus Peribacteria bacterium RIFCSPHIGHO2_12_FULL_54_10]OGJ69065.1 MAG: hypothetical protein A2947_00330 [Candidatus Peribacteria bacterium RIFCSPLOWO2_01_FULL_54_110]OGJ69945.1 MAG: hypothetical protein A3H90_00980 [Candidatus Pe